MSVLDDFSDRLKELMIINSLKPEALSEKIGISGESIRRYCKCMSAPNFQSLIKLADFFKCSTEYLIGRTDKYLEFNLFPALPFKDRLNEIQKEKSKPIRYFDKNTKLKDGYFYHWNRGADPNLFTLVELSDLLECTIDYLAGRERSS